MTDASIVPRPAATVVLLRPGPAGPEVLLTHRPTTMAFAADMHVFPGGRVDAGDADPRLAARSTTTPADAARALGGDLPPAAALAAHVAAIREAFEEVGVLLADHDPAADLDEARRQLLAAPDAFADIADRLDLRLWTDRLVPLSRWVTPPGLGRRFDTRFFAAPMPPGIEPTLVGDEVVAHGWQRPIDALESMAAGRIGMWLPTSTTLMALEHVRSIDDLARMSVGRLGGVEVEDIDADIVRIEMPAGGGVAGQPVNAYLVGRTSFVLVDPGDPTGPGLERAVAVARRRGGSIAGIALTHADPDHAAGAEALALELGIPIHVGPGRGRYLPYEHRTLTDDASIDAGDVGLRAVLTPGPTIDHVAFVVGDGGVVISGDLDGVRGARSIPGPVDAVALERSIERLRTVAPGARWLAGHPA